MKERLKLPTILVITDNPSIRYWVKRHLDDSFFILEVSTRDKAIEAVRSSSLSYVLLDDQSEEIDPLNLSIEIKNIQQTPIYLITGRLNKQYRKKATQSGITAFLSDQLDIEELRQKISAGEKNILIKQKTAELFPSPSVKLSPEKSLKNKVSLRTKLHILDLGYTPIFEQLQIEEALLRTSTENICIINRGSPLAIVMGISNKPEELLVLDKVKNAQIPIIRRFSGGGTVIVDEDTLFFTFIFEKGAIPISPFPEPILRWSGDLYQESWKIPAFQLIENDYVIRHLKCGGNAQYIKKDRWLHHTSFLWDYKKSNMDYLKLPAKQPEYRHDRNHEEFLCKLKEYASSKEDLIQKLLTHLQNRFECISMNLNKLAFPSHRKALQKLTL